MADEPPATLSVSAREALTVLASLTGSIGKTIVMVTHDAQAARYASTIRHLEKGVLLEDGALPDEWVESDPAATVSSRITRETRIAPS